LMTAENLDAYKRMMVQPLAPESFEPWVRQLRPEDRIVIDQQKPPELPGVEWKVLGNQMWFGRLIRRGSTTPVPFHSGLTWAAVAPIN
jgi:hypothetical protein